MVPGTEVPGYYHSVPEGRVFAFQHWRLARDQMIGIMGETPMLES